MIWFSFNENYCRDNPLIKGELNDTELSFQYLQFVGTKLIGRRTNDFIGVSLTNLSLSPSLSLSSYNDNEQEMDASNIVNVTLFFSRLSRAWLSLVYIR